MTTSPEMVADLIRNALDRGPSVSSVVLALACRIGACTVLMSAPLAIALMLGSTAQSALRHISM